MPLPRMRRRLSGWGVATEGAADRLGQRLGAIDDKQAADGRVETSLDQVVE